VVFRSEESVNKILNFAKHSTIELKKGRFNCTVAFLERSLRCPRDVGQTASWHLFGHLTPLPTSHTNPYGLSLIPYSRGGGRTPSQWTPSAGFHLVLDYE
jgi:hypothetical protein